MQDLRPAALQEVTSRVLEVVAADTAGGVRVDPVALVFLLRRYAATDDVRLRETVGNALAVALAQQTDEQPLTDRIARLVLFTEARSWSDDERLAEASADLVSSLMRDRSSSSTIAETAAICDVCLRAGNPDVTRAVVDDLEASVARHYRPGAGMVNGSAADQTRTASALLTAYEATGRLPYAMLAEELMQTAQRIGWGNARGTEDAVGFDLMCDAARVLCRLVALHRDEGYLRSAVVAPGADYRAQAQRLLTELASTEIARGAGAASFGLALAEYLDLQ